MISDGRFCPLSPKLANLSVIRLLIILLKIVTFNWEQLVCSRYVQRLLIVYSNTIRVSILYLTPFFQNSPRIYGVCFFILPTEQGCMDCQYSTLSSIWSDGRRGWSSYGGHSNEPTKLSSLRGPRRKGHHNTQSTLVEFESFNIKINQI